MNMLPEESLKYRALKESVLWENDRSIYYTFYRQIRANRIKRLINSNKRHIRFFKIRFDRV